MQKGDTEEMPEKDRMNSQTKKILIITSVWGFLAKFGQEDIKVLHDLGYEVHYASNKSNPIYHFPDTVYEEMKVYFHNIDIWQSPFGLTHNLRAIKQIRKLIKEEGISVLHCHTPSGGLVTRLAGIGLPVRVIYTVHGFHFYKGAGRLHNLIYHSIEGVLSCLTDVIVTVNQEDCEAAEKMCQREGAFRIPGVGLNRDYFHETSFQERKAARKTLGVEDRYFILSVGELRENKNPEVIIRAIARMKDKERAADSFRYGLLGAGKQEEELKKLAEELGISNQVIFYGYHEDVRPYLQAADVLAFPTIREGLGMAALEAMAMGVPVLAADNRGTREFMKDGENGYICRRNDPDEYAGLLLKMYREQEDWCLNVGKRARIRRSTEPFDKKYTAEIMRKIYEKTKDKRTIVCL